ncbi:hypothetical protein PCANC_07526 [Puccinia coronata f. sp. avenae]|uniref:Uncharacterized protein n=1 Tax=Puccinia coronata f. sp. avenae TaxID=200324 RepID=A0A2N5VSM2_9BASI|nr:hypothetical protein PCANC_07526 [Puccinia coronata f. sp. avenae]
MLRKNIIEGQSCVDPAICGALCVPLVQSLELQERFQSCNPIKKAAKPLAQLSISSFHPIPPHCQHPDPNSVPPLHLAFKRFNPSQNTCSINLEEPGQPTEAPGQPQGLANLCLGNSESGSLLSGALDQPTHLRQEPLSPSPQLCRLAPRKTLRSTTIVLVMPSLASPN